MGGLPLTLAVPSVATSLAGSKDTDPPLTFVASPPPSLQLKGPPSPVRPTTTGPEGKAPVISLGPATAATSGFVLPASVTEVGVGGGGYEEAMEETGAHNHACASVCVCVYRCGCVVCV